MSQVVGTILIGSLINLIIFIAIGRVGLLPAILISVITPFVAVIEGHLANILLGPAVALGNCIIAIVWWVLHNKLKLVSQTITVIIASALKFLFLWWAVPWTFTTFLYSSWRGSAPAAKVLSTLTANMSWPQLVTALIGGTFAVIILRVLPKK